MNINNKNSQRGAALVEFVLVVPLLLLFLFGIIEFSVILYDKAVVTNASREAARAWIVYRDDADKLTSAEVIQIVTAYTNDRLISFGGQGLTTTPSRSPVPSVATGATGQMLFERGASLTVTVDYEYDFLLLPALAKNILPTINLRAETIMRAE